MLIPVPPTHNPSGITPFKFLRCESKASSCIFCWVVVFYFIIIFFKLNKAELFQHLTLLLQADRG